MRLIAMRLLTHRGTHIFFLLVLLGAAVLLRMQGLPGIERFRQLTFDGYNKLVPRPAFNDVLIVDIDEESLRRYGQWPWPRTLVGDLPVILRGLGAKAVAFDMAFAEPDRTSPASLAERLPPGIGYEWTDLAYQQRQAGNTAILIFGASVLFVFLVLAAQYESWTLPLAIVLIVPMCLLAAVTGLLFRDMNVDILAQIGFVVLVGLAAKNAILIVEFAVMKHKEGLSHADAAVEAAKLRLRPIVMTSLAFILGAVPLFIASGAGSNSRHSIGTGIIGGMIAATTLALLFVPLFSWLVGTAADKWAARRGKPAPGAPVSPSAGEPS